MDRKIIVFLVLFFQCFFIFANNKDTLVVYIKAQESTNEFQNALNSKDKRTLKVVLQKGKHNIIRDLTIIRDNVYIKGEKGSVVYFKNNTGIIVQGDKIVIEGITFEGTGTSAKDYYSGYAILLNGANHCIIKNNIFEKIAGNNIFLYPRNGNKGSSYNKISSNQFLNPKFNISNNGDEGAIILGYSGTDYEHNYNLIENNIVDGNFTLKVGIGIIGHGNHNTIKKNTIKNMLAYGILLYESKNLGYTLHSNEILENIVMNVGEQGQKTTVKGMGIYIMSAIKSVVSENKVTNTLQNSDKTESLGAGAISISLSPNSIIKNNDIFNSGMYGIVSDYSFDSVFKGNKVKDIKKSAMYFINENDILVEENHFQNIGETVFKGYFQNTGIQSIKDQIANKKYHNLSTGNNIKIENNQIVSDNQLLFFIGTTKEEVGMENKIENNSFINNIITRSLKKEESDNNITFKNTKNKNNITRNKFIKK